MRDLRLLDVYRRTDRAVVEYYGGVGDHEVGCFAVPSPIDGGHLAIIASALGDWDHVSVSRKNRTPNWREMEHVRGLFFKDDETVMQLSVPRADHINDHPHCLHLWRPHKEAIPMPPKWMVGGVSREEADRQAAAAGVK